MGERKGGGEGETEKYCYISPYRHLGIDPWGAASTCSHRTPLPIPFGPPLPLHSFIRMGIRLGQVQYPVAS